jgi:hypothetical protein
VISAIRRVSHEYTADRGVGGKIVAPCPPSIIPTLQKHHQSKMKLILPLALCFAASGIMAQSQEFVTLPCNCAASEVPFVYNPAVLTGIPVSSVYLAKSEKRHSFKDLTARERRKLQRLAHRKHACQILVFDRYRPNGFTPEAEAKNRALHEKEIQVLLVQGVRPCPECPSQGDTGMR